jgi:SPP1 gp7 family putative phage head morphogenesis protein
MFNRFSEEYLNKFYSKGAKPQIIVESEAVTREQMDILRTSFEDHYSGRYNERKALVLPKGAKANPVLNRIADQELIDLIRVNRETILNLLRIPKHAVSLQEAGSLGSEEHKMALKYMWSATIKPALKRFSGHFTKFFAAELGPDYCIEFDTTDVEIFHEDLLQKAELAEKMLATRTLNEVRREIWEADPVEGGDTVRGVQSPYDVQPALPIPPTTGGNPEESTEPDPLDANKLLEPEKPKTQKADFQAFYSKNKEAVDSHHKRIDEVLAGNVQGMETWAQEQLLAQAEAAFKALKTSEKASLDKEQFKKNLSSEMAKLYKNYRDGYVQKLSGVQETGYSLQLGMVFDADARAAVEAVRERDESKRVKILEARGLQSFQLVAKTSAKTIMEIVGEGMEAKNTIAEIAKNISAFFSKDAYYRAQRIARTEVLTAVSLGQWAAVKNASDHVPNLKKMWMSAQDSRVRDTHAYLDGAVVGFDEEFENGLKFPREPGGVPSEVIQCRCSLAVVSEKDIDLIQ